MDPAHLDALLAGTRRLVGLAEDTAALMTGWAANVAEIDLRDSRMASDDAARLVQALNRWRRQIELVTADATRIRDQIQETYRVVTDPSRWPDMIEANSRLGESTSLDLLEADLILDEIRALVSAA